MRIVRGNACLVASCFAALAAAADGGRHADVAGLRVELRGTLVLPDEAADADGRTANISGLSGVAWLGADRYVAVLDNSDRLVGFALELARDGKPLAVRELTAVRVGAVHDFEDVVVCPAPFRRAVNAVGPCLLLAEEDTPAIRAVAQGGGDLLGSVPLPELLARRRPNRGLEALAVDPDDGGIWTANEEALAGDGPGPREGGGTTVRLVRVPPPAEPRRPTRQYAYDVEPPHAFARVFPGDPLAGVCAIAALGGGRLLVLERSAGPGLPPFLSRLYLVDTARADDVSAVARDLAAHAARRPTKRLLWEEPLGCNVEGLCLGPPLAAGGQAVVAVADNGGLGTPNQLVVLALLPGPVTSP